MKLLNENLKRPLGKTVGG